MGEKKVKSILSIVVYCLLLLLIIFQYSTEYGEQERSLYFALLFAYCICAALIVVAIIKHNLYFFEPFSMISVWYTVVFVFRPLTDLRNSSMVESGINVMQGGVKATIIFVLGFVCFYFGYYVHSRGRFRNRIQQQDAVIQNIAGTREVRTSSTLLIGWGFSFLLCIICLLSQGFSLSYIFSLSGQGGRTSTENPALMFLSNFGATLVTYWLMIVVKPGNKLLKISITVVTFFYLVMRNSRWLLLVLVLSPFVYFYVKRRKRPNTIVLVIIFVALALLFAWMQFNRNSIRFGQEMMGLNGDWLNVENFVLPFDLDFGIYKVFYGMVLRYPSFYPYMLGSTFLYTFVLLIPRAIWQGKPDNPVRDMIEHSLNSTARKSGAASPNIGEFYANFGYLGVAVLMALFGGITSRLKKLYENPSENRLLAYSILFPLLYQWVARGNFNGNLYITVFALLPFGIEKIIQQIWERRFGPVKSSIQERKA